MFTGTVLYTFSTPKSTKKKLRFSSSFLHTQHAQNYFFFSLPTVGFSPTAKPLPLCPKRTTDSISHGSTVSIANMALLVNLSNSKNSWNSFSSTIKQPLSTRSNDSYSWYDYRLIGYYNGSSWFVPNMHLEVVKARLKMVSSIFGHHLLFAQALQRVSDHTLTNEILKYAFTPFDKMVFAYHRRAVAFRNDRPAAAAAGNGQSQTPSPSMGNGNRKSAVKEAFCKGQNYGTKHLFSERSDEFIRKR